MKSEEIELQSLKVKGSCFRCIHSKMYGCTQGREAYPYGDKDTCKPTKKRKGYEVWKE